MVTKIEIIWYRIYEWHGQLNIIQDFERRQIKINEKVFFFPMYVYIKFN